MIFFLRMYLSLSSILFPSHWQNKVPSLLLRQRSAHVCRGVQYGCRGDVIVGHGAAGVQLEGMKMSQRKGEGEEGDEGQSGESHSQGQNHRAFFS